MKIGRRSFLRGIIATGAAAAVPAFIIRREPEPEFAPDGFDEATVVDIEAALDEEFTGESLFMPGEGESFSNVLHPSHATTLTRENFDRARCEMLRQMREPIRPHVILVPPGDYAHWQAILDSIPPGKVERVY